MPRHIASLWVKLHLCRRRRAAAKRARQRVRMDVSAAIDRLAKSLDIGVHNVARHRKRLFEPIATALSHLDTVLGAIPGPIDLDPDLWDRDPLLNAVFISPDEITRLLRACRPLRDYFQTRRSSEAHVLMTMKKKEHIRTGARHDGRVVDRAALLHTVYFERHRLIGAAPTLSQTRREIRYRALHALVLHALTTVEDIRKWKAELEREQDLLEFALDSPGGRQADAAADSDHLSEEKTRDVETTLEALEAKIRQIDAELEMAGNPLAQVARTLSEADAHLTLVLCSMRLNKMGVIVPETSTEPVNRFALAEFQLAGRLKRTAIWATVQRRHAVSRPS